MTEADETKRLSPEEFRKELIGEFIGEFQVDDARYAAFQEAGEVIEREIASISKSPQELEDWAFQDGPRANLGRLAVAVLHRVLDRVESRGRKPEMATDTAEHLAPETGSTSLRTLATLKAVLKTLQEREAPLNNDLLDVRKEIYQIEKEIAGREQDIHSVRLVTLNEVRAKVVLGSGMHGSAEAALKAILDDIDTLKKGAG